MTLDPRPDITELLERTSAGDRVALDALVPLIYDELRRMASSRMLKERSAHTLGVTGLVHETMLRLSGQEEVRWSNRGHFFAVASMTMRRILVNWARDRGRSKRGDGVTPLLLNDIELPGHQPDADTVLAVDQALAKLSDLSSRAVRVVECRFFAGLSVEETAVALDVSARTVKREWQLARAWLRKELADNPVHLLSRVPSA